MLPQRFTRTQCPDEKYVATGFAETGLTKSMLPQRFTRTQRPDEKYVAIRFAEIGLTRSMLCHRFKRDEKYFVQSVYTQIGPDGPYVVLLSFFSLPMLPPDSKAEGKSSEVAQPRRGRDLSGPRRPGQRSAF
jgi:hypothetical protein